MANRNTIKSWFKTGYFPNAAQFSSTWDSFVHKDDGIPIDKIIDLTDRFNEIDENLSNISNATLTDDTFDI